MNTNHVLTCVASGLLGVAVVGCDSGKSVYVESGGPNTVVTLDQINIQDWNKAAMEMTNSLLESTALDNAPRKPAVFAISKIQNATGLRIDTDMLTKNIGVSLTKTGKVVRTIAFGDEDPLAKETKGIDDFAEDRKNTVVTGRPDFTLSGKILEDKARAGDVRQTTYTFQMSLVDRSARVVWEDQKQITKQGKKSSVGW